MTLPQAPGAETGTNHAQMEEGNGSPNPSSQQPGARSSRPSFPLWLRLSLFFLSAIFFLSAFFAIFSPLPLLFQYFGAGRRWAWLSALTNSALVYLAGGAGSLLLFLIFGVAVALPMAELLKRRKSLEAAALASLIAMATAGFGFATYYSKVHHQNPWAEVRQSISESLDHLSKSVQENGRSSKDFPTEPAELEEWKQGLLVELPSAVAVISLIFVWANLVALLRLNPGRIRESLGIGVHFFREWKAPEYLVWPTLLAGFFLLVNVPRVSPMAINVFKFLMAIYAIQGLSILSFFFDQWRLKPIFRTLGFLAALFVMMPLLLSLGFFDLWFDFRAKFRQS